MYKIYIRLHRSELLLKFCRDITSFFRTRPTFIEFLSRHEQHQMKTVFGTKNDIDKHDSEATEHSFKTLTTVNEKQSRNKVKFRSRHEQHQMKTVFGTKNDVDKHDSEATNSPGRGHESQRAPQRARARRQAPTGLPVVNREAVDNVHFDHGQIHCQRSFFQNLPGWRGSCNEIFTSIVEFNIMFC